MLTFSALRRFIPGPVKAYSNSGRSIFVATHRSTCWNIASIVQQQQSIRLNSTKAVPSPADSVSSSSSGPDTGSGLVARSSPVVNPMKGKLPYLFPSVEVPREVAAVLSLQTANKKEKLRYNINIAVDKFKIHKLDTGTTPVQSKQTVCMIDCLTD